MDLWALTEWNTPYEKIQQPIPEPQGTEVLIKVTHAGLCHSDLHFYEGFYDLGNDKRFYVKDRGVKLPVAGGHEILGTIAKLGPDAAGSHLQIGSSQIVYPWLGCGKCTRCKQEEDNLCAAQVGLGTLKNGGFADYVVVPHPKYLVELGDLDPAIACTFSCAGVTTLSSIDKLMPLPPDEPVLLIGAGGVGLSAISMLRAYGHKNIISVDISDDKLATATKAGATKVVNSSCQDPSKAILEATGGPVIAVIDFVNNSKTAAMVNGLVAKGAKWVQVGVMGGSIELSLVANIFRGLSIFSNITGSPAHLREVTRLAKEGKLPPVPIMKMPMDSVNEAVQILKDNKATGRIILVK